MYDGAKVRALNDEFRKTFRGGKVVTTQGIAALPDLFTILSRVREFDQFDPENDPYGEHDFGAFLHCGQQCFWKIDYYDVDLQAGSPDAADSAVTTRILTVMLAEEY